MPPDSGPNGFAPLRALLARARYAPVELPILQPAAIFLEVAGEELRRRLFLTSDPAGQDLCLRPDLTIPTARLHMAGGDPRRPARYSYLGPVFRYREEGPSEFLQAGAESFGFADPDGEEADTLALAFEAVRTLGVARPALRIGDVGLLDALIGALGLSPAARRALHRDLSGDRRPGGRLAETPDRSPPTQLAGLLELGPERARHVLREVLTLSGVEEIGGRTVEEVADRLLDLASLSDGRAAGGAVRGVVAGFLELEGSPPALLSKLHAFSRRVPLDLSAALGRFETRLAAFAARGLDPETMHAATAFGSDLDYYTGLVFELADARRPGHGRLVAGGRYDRLLASLGAAGEVPAIGFSLWLDRFADGAR